ncbi:glycosyl transferase [Ochrobactrum sp. MYb29]|nr:glycosyl transferase [Ochrobactrum sp. MYb29]
MKAYLINLDRSKDRLAHMAEQFREMGIEFVRVPAVDGRGLSKEKLNDLIDNNRKWAGPITGDEVGCFLSHRKCLEAIAAGEDKFGIVFEDDISFASGSNDLLTSTEWIPADADIIKLETSGKKVMLGERKCSADLPVHVSPLLSVHILSAGYIVSRKAAALITRRMIRIAEPLDHFLFDPEYGVFEELNIYQCTPALCRQDDWESTIRKGHLLIKKDRSLSAVIGRECRRFLRRSRIGLLGFWANRFTRKKWGPVPFHPDV